MKRHLILQRPAETIASAIVQQIQLQPGVAAVMFDPESRRLDIQYDASQLQIGEVREIVRAQGEVRAGLVGESPSALVPLYRPEHP
ncbi:heavy-metal-associated domain-containing protein [Marinobacterium aestuariivivens]|uniref:heavy-metal-associated domain-containing protein n=1 Tax=Marinobacterium aestuariivivens TaxID=1698799 RepID=UPI0036D2E5F0